MSGSRRPKHQLCAAKPGAKLAVTLSPYPTQVPLFQALPGLRVAQVAAGKQHSLALTEAGVYAWGDNRFGQLGVGKAVARSSTPRLVPGLGRAVGVACGQFHSLARDAEGRLMTWGWGVHGQLGLGGIEDSGRPMLVRALANHRVVSIGAGYAHSVVLTRWTKKHLTEFTLGFLAAKARCSPLVVDFLVNLAMGEPLRLSCLFRFFVVDAQRNIYFLSCNETFHQVVLPGPCNLLSSGYFHCVAGLTQGGIMLWGNNPQVFVDTTIAKVPIACVSVTQCHRVSRESISIHNRKVLRLEAQQRKKERQAARKAEEKRLEEEEVGASIIIFLTIVFPSG